MLGSLAGAIVSTILSAITTLSTQGESWIVDGKKATYGLAGTRILLGSAILGLLLTNFDTRFYTFGAGMAWTGQLQNPTSDFVSIWPFGMYLAAAPYPALSTAMYVACIVFAVLFILGYRTRLATIGMFVLWISIIETNDYVQDQSDNLVRIALIVMFFAAPADRWSLDARRRRKFTERSGIRSSRNPIVRWWRFQRVLPEWFTNIFHNFAIVALACQVAFVYVAGGLYKAGGTPWSGGTAIYDPLHVAQFAPWPELSDLVTSWAPAVAFATVLTLLVQVSFPLLLLRRGTRIFALVVMLCFHLGIAILMGLPWFSLSMIAIDCIFIRDATWQQVQGAIRGAWDGTRSTTRERSS
ncbi:HTTM domain-containing protein [Leifsonia sp. NPDC058230]|uniref:HTTM domain-containing protein n=1 Tax=Leifsonia sp. NPDC058230 TaxID=3346391 RepID=UPI0036D82B14